MTNEEELIRKAALGCVDSIRNLMLLHRSYVRGVIVKFVKNQTDMEDIEQDVWVKLFTHIVVIEPNARNTIRHWLASCAANLCIDLIRKNNKDYVDIFDIELPAATEHPVDTLYRSNMSVDLWKAIQELPERQKEVIVREYWSGESHIQMANNMNTTVSSVESLAKRARKQLRVSFRKVQYEFSEEIMD